MLNLNEGEPLDGITHSTLFVSASGSMFPWHCEEADMGSVNYLHRPNRSIDEFNIMPVCEKVWHIVPPGEFHLFEAVVEALVERLSCKYKCQNWLMHRFLMFSPETLNKFGINTFYTRQGEGETMVIYPSTYHCGKQFVFFNTIYKFLQNLPNIPGYNTNPGIASASGWLSEEFWFRHAVHSRNCDPKCTHPKDKNGKKLKPAKKVDPYDMRDLFLERNAMKYVKIWDARKAMDNGQKEYHREDTDTFKNMSPAQRAVLEAIDHNLKELLPSK